MAPALLAANGAPIKVVLGYVSTARVLLALEQGEIDGSFTVGNALATRTDLFGKVVPIGGEPSSPATHDRRNRSKTCVCARNPSVWVITTSSSSRTLPMPWACGHVEVEPPTG